MSLGKEDWKYEKKDRIMLEVIGNLKEIPEHNNGFKRIRFCAAAQIFASQKARTAYYNARWYDPNTGRFITEDPAQDGVNWYAYVGNNPMSDTDPSGMYNVGQYYPGKGIYAGPGGGGSDRWDTPPPPPAPTPSAPTANAQSNNDPPFTMFTIAKWIQDRSLDIANFGWQAQKQSADTWNPIGWIAGGAIGVVGTTVGVGIPTSIEDLRLMIFSADSALYYRYFATALFKAPGGEAISLGRLGSLGRTPGKASATGRQVIEQMSADGKIMEDADLGTLFKASDGQWYPLKLADMSHKVDAVTWWNLTGRAFGAKAPEVRQWMLDPQNYFLDLFSFNRSAGAKLGQTYLPPLK